MGRSWIRLKSIKMAMNNEDTPDKQQCDISTLELAGNVCLSTLPHDYKSITRDHLTISGEKLKKTMPLAEPYYQDGCIWQLEVGRWSNTPLNECSPKSPHYFCVYVTNYKEKWKAGVKETDLSRINGRAEMKIEVYNNDYDRKNKVASSRRIVHFEHQYTKRVDYFKFGLDAWPVLPSNVDEEKTYVKINVVIKYYDNEKSDILTEKKTASTQHNFSPVVFRCPDLTEKWEINQVVCSDVVFVFSEEIQRTPPHNIPLSADEIRIYYDNTRIERSSGGFATSAQKRLKGEGGANQPFLNKLYANKSLLCIWSPVMAKMFNGTFSETSAEEIPLHDKDINSFHDLLKIVHCPGYNVINSGNAASILPLAHEYMMEEVVKKCEEVLIANPEVKLLQNLLWAEMYSLKRLRDSCVEKAASLHLDELQNKEGFTDLDKSLQLEIYEKMIKMKNSKKISNVSLARRIMSPDYHNQYSGYGEYYGDSSD